MLRPFPALLVTDAHGAITIWGLPPSASTGHKLYSWKAQGGAITRAALYRITMTEKLRRERETVREGGEAHDLVRGSGGA